MKLEEEISVLKLVFSLLSRRDLLRCRLVCKVWRDSIETFEGWKRHFLDLWKVLPNEGSCLLPLQGNIETFTSENTTWFRKWMNSFMSWGGNMFLSSSLVYYYKKSWHVENLIQIKTSDPTAMSFAEVFVRSVEITRYHLLSEETRVEIYHSPFELDPSLTIVMFDFVVTLFGRNIYVLRMIGKDLKIYCELKPNIEVRKFRGVNRNFVLFETNSCLKLLCIPFEDDRLYPKGTTIEVLESQVIFQNQSDVVVFSVEDSPRITERQILSSSSLIKERLLIKNEWILKCEKMTLRSAINHRHYHLPEMKNEEPANFTLTPNLLVTVQGAFIFVIPIGKREYAPLGGRDNFTSMMFKDDLLHDGFHIIPYPFPEDEDLVDFRIVGGKAFFYVGEKIWIVSYAQPAEVELYCNKARQQILSFENEDRVYSPALTLLSANFHRLKQACSKRDSALLDEVMKEVSNVLQGSNIDRIYERGVLPSDVCWKKLLLKYEVKRDAMESGRALLLRLGQKGIPMKRHCLDFHDFCKSIDSFKSQWNMIDPKAIDLYIDLKVQLETLAKEEILNIQKTTEELKVTDIESYEAVAAFFEAFREIAEAMEYIDEKLKLLLHKHLNSFKTDVGISVAPLIEDQQAVIVSEIFASDFPPPNLWEWWNERTQRWIATSSCFGWTEFGEAETCLGEKLDIIAEKLREQLKDNAPAEEMVSSSKKVEDISYFLSKSSKFPFLKERFTDLSTGFKNWAFQFSKKNKEVLESHKKLLENIVSKLEDKASAPALKKRLEWMEDDVKSLKGFLKDIDDKADLLLARINQVKDSITLPAEKEETETDFLEEQLDELEEQQDLESEDEDVEFVTDEEGDEDEEGEEEEED